MATRKYQVYKKQVSYDGGDTWEDVLPVETMKMPVYGETCEVGYSVKRAISGYIHPAAQVAWDVDGVFAMLPPMHTLTKTWVNLLRFYHWNSADQTKDYWNGDINTPLIIGKEVEEIGASAYTDSKVFYGTGVIFEKPSKVKKINSYAFLNNTSWDSIDIPDSVERIESYAFAASGFSKAMYVTIGTGCTYIGDKAFSDIGYSFVGELEKNIRFSGSTPPELGNNALGEKALIIVSDGSLSQYRSEWSGISGDVISDVSLGNSAKAETNIYSGITSIVYNLPNDGSSALTYSDFTEYVSDGDIKMSWLKIGDSVRTIPENAFSGKCGNIQYLDLGNGVETIGSNAFNAYGLVSNLMDITIPDSVKSIGNGAFYYNDRVRNITIGTGCTYIGDNAFGGGNRIEANLYLPDNVEHIGQYNFDKHMVGFDFHFPTSLRELGVAAFGLESTQSAPGDIIGRRNFLNEIKLPSIEKLGVSALTVFFTNYLEIGGNVEEIGSGQCIPTAVAIGATTPPPVMDSSVIDDIDKIGWMKTSLIYVPDPLIDTYKATYGWCYLRQHIFPLSEIGDILDFADGYKFCGLYDREGTTVSPYSTNKEQGLFKYGEYDGSTTLTSGETVWNSSQGYGSGGPDKIWIGDNVEYVDGDSFPMLCYPTLIVFGTGLKEFVFLGNQCTYVFKTATPPEFSCKNYTIAERDNGDGTTETGVTISPKKFVMYVPDGAVETYKSWLHDNGVEQKLYKGETEMTIDNYLIYPLSDFCNYSGNLGRRWVEVPGQYQYGCSGTTKVKMAIEKEQATTDWINWTDTGRVRPGDAEVVERFSRECGYSGYSGKVRGTRDNGSTVEIPCNGSGDVNRNETTGTIRSNLSEYVEIGNCVDTIGRGAFSGFSKIKEVVFASGVTTIASDAFAGCTNLSRILLPDTLTYMYDNVFSGCTSLMDINIPIGVTSIETEAFCYCTSLTSCTISGVTSIGMGAFRSCGITNIVIPSGVTYIGDYAFRASSLQSATILATTPPSLGGNYVFYNTNDCPIYVPAASVETYKAASGWSTYASRIQAIT